MLDYARDYIFLVDTEHLRMRQTIRLKRSISKAHKFAKLRAIHNVEIV